MTAPVRAASLLLFLAIIALGGGLLALHFAGTSPAQAQDGSVPDQPTGLSTEAFHDRVNLTWDDPDDDSITHYKVLRRDRDVHDTGEFVTIDSDTGIGGDELRRRAPWSRKNATCTGSWR